jgi:hypothetical protein
VRSPWLATPEFEFDRQRRPLAGKIRQVERGVDADLAAGGPNFPGDAHEHLGSDLPEERRPQIDGIAPKRVLLGCCSALRAARAVEDGLADRLASISFLTVIPKFTLSLF